MADILKTPIVWVTVLILFPMVHPWAMRFIFRQIQMKWFVVSNIAIVGIIFLISTIHQDLLLRYTGPKDAGGIATIHLAYEWAVVGSLVGWTEKNNKANAVVMTAISVVGLVLLLLGLWVS
jgi:hypothetical protein